MAFAFISASDRRNEIVRCTRLMLLMISAACATNHCLMAADEIISQSRILVVPRVLELVTDDLRKLAIDPETLGRLRDEKAVLVDLNSADPETAFEIKTPKTVGRVFDLLGQRGIKMRYPYVVKVFRRHLVRAWVYGAMKETEREFELTPGDVVLVGNYGDFSPPLIMEEKEIP